MRLLLYILVTLFLIVGVYLLLSSTVYALEQSCIRFKGDSLVKIIDRNDVVCEKLVDKMIDQGWKLFSYVIPNQSLDTIDGHYEIWVLIK